MRKRTEKRRTKATVQRIGGDSAKSRRTKRGSAKKGSTRGRRIKKESAKGRKTKGKSAEGKRTGILVVVSIFVIVNILVFLFASF